MRVCFLDEALFRGGSDSVNGSRVQILALARELMRRGHEVTLVSGSERDDPVDTYGDCADIPLVVLRRSSYFPLLGSRIASRAVKDYAPDVLYARGRTYLTGVAAWEQWRRGVGFVWASNAEEGCERWKHVAHLWRSSRPLARKVLRTSLDFLTDLFCDWGVGRADRHVCQTQHQCDRLLAVHHKEGRIVRSLQTLPESLTARQVPPLVLWIGRLSVERAPEAFLELARALTSSDCDFALVGPTADPRYSQSMALAVEELPRFRYIGRVSFRESWDWIAKATVLVNTSLVEGLSNALVQAWHCGVPTVTLHFDPDGIIEKNGVGYLSGDATSMAAQVGTLVGDETLRQAMSARAKDLAEREFSAESVGMAYETLMQEAAASHE